MKILFLLVALYCSTIAPTASASVYDTLLSVDEKKRAESMYQQYCSLCHGKNREGHAADHAPSLRSKSLMSTAPTAYLSIAVEFGRPGTAMSAYLDEMGGPLNIDDITMLVKWLKAESGHKDVKFSKDIVNGDAIAGKTVYQAQCASCHGDKGEGHVGPALSNNTFLSYATDDFIKYAIVNGRDGTPMPAFKQLISEQSINDLVAYIRSNVYGDIPVKTKLRPIPSEEDYILNPNNPAPEFKIKDGRYISIHQLKQALEDKKRFVLLDTRTKSEWYSLHIPGSIPIPYYSDDSEVTKGLPKDGTWIVAYCACPRAASETVVDALRENGFVNTLIIYEGFFAWIDAEYPVNSGRITSEPVELNRNGVVAVDKQVEKGD
ncbi:c-type cytochrome [Pseudoalteromonas sp. ASV78]|uniref:c-type cytochrome n=1 Tax=Pseudoalteromonas sp. ASV78 TaxID=3397851 RepID=UPI0039FCBFA0